MILGFVLGPGPDIKSVGDSTDPPAPILLTSKARGTQYSFLGLSSSLPGAVDPLDAMSLIPRSDQERP